MGIVIKFFRAIMILIMILAIGAIILLAVLKKSGIDVEKMIMLNQSDNIGLFQTSETQPIQNHTNTNEVGTSIQTVSSTVEITPQVVEIKQIQTSMQGQSVLTRGMVRDIYTSKKGHTFFSIVDSSGAKIKGVLFKDDVDKLPTRLTFIKDNNNTNKVINFEGKVDIYEGELEVIVRKVY